MAVPNITEIDKRLRLEPETRQLVAAWERKIGAIGGARRWPTLSLSLSVYLDVASHRADEPLGEKQDKQPLKGYGRRLMADGILIHIGKEKMIKQFWTSIAKLTK